MYTMVNKKDHVSKKRFEMIKLTIFMMFCKNDPCWPNFTTILFIYSLVFNQCENQATTKESPNHTIYVTSCFPESYKMPFFKAKINKLDLISLLLAFRFLLFFFGALYRPPWPFPNITH